MDSPDFNTMNETDVREIIVRPLLERLGYRHGSQANIRTEVSLRYGKTFLGRKNAAKDPPLAGRADYVCDAIPYGRWVVEVKGAAEPLTEDVRDQTHTYAAHPEIAAAFFMLTNGRKFELYRTSSLESPILEWTFTEIEEKLLSLFNLVSPAALQKLANLVRPDPGKPLGRGLPSKLRVIGGMVTYDDHTSTVPALSKAITGLSLPIIAGSVERTGDGRIHAHVKLANAAALMPDLNAAMGIDDTYDFYSVDEFVSSNIAAPSIFQNFEMARMEKGAPLTMPGFPTVPAWFRYEMRAFTQAVGFVEGSRFKGTMAIDYDLSFTDVDPMMRKLLEAQWGHLPAKAEMKGAGHFDLELADAV